MKLGGSKQNINIKDFSLGELEAELSKLGEKPYRTRQIFEWIYQKDASDFDKMSNLPAPLRETLRRKFYISSYDIIKKEISKLDGTRKYLFKLEDGEAVEAVLIPTASRNTMCLSSQAGCPFACKFCASGLSGIKRDLRCSEILDQALGIADDLKGQRITNVVMMGMGEPLANYDNVMKAIGILNSPFGFAIGARKITISTAGYIPGMRRFMKEKPQIELSLSLHGATDGVRSYLMPINKRYPLDELMRVCRDYVSEKSRIITFEYILIKGINASRQDAIALSKLLKDLPCKVNLIPFNPISDSDFLPPTEKEVKEFQKILKNSGINPTIRAQRGADIDAACGQLRLISGNQGGWFQRRK